MEKRKYCFQKCQDEKITSDFRKLHEELVNRVVDFCREHDIVIDEFHMGADCMSESIKFGYWCPVTDSSLEFDQFTQEYKDARSLKTIVNDEEWDRIKSEQEPFLFSM